MELPVTMNNNEDDDDKAPYDFNEEEDEKLIET